MAAVRSELCSVGQLGLFGTRPWTKPAAFLLSAAAMNTRAAGASPFGLLAAGEYGMRVRQARVAFNARNGAQILVDRSKVMVGHVLKDRPGHYLKKWPKLGMRVIRINTRPKDSPEFFKRRPAFRPAELVRS